MKVLPWILSAIFLGTGITFFILWLKDEKKLKPATGRKYIPPIVTPTDTTASGSGMGSGTGTNTTIPPKSTSTVTTSSVATISSRGGTAIPLKFGK